MVTRCVTSLAHYSRYGEARQALARIFGGVGRRLTGRWGGEDAGSIPRHFGGPREPAAPPRRPTGMAGVVASPLPFPTRTPGAPAMRQRTGPLPHDRWGRPAAGCWPWRPPVPTRPPRRCRPAGGRSRRPCPVLKGELVAAMQEGRFEEAVAALEKLDADPKATAARQGVLRPDPGDRAPAGQAARGAPARPCAAAIDADPKGPWVAEAPLGAGRRRAGRRPLQGGRGPGPRRGRGPAGRRPQGRAGRGVSRLRPPPAEARRADHPGRPRGGVCPAEPGPTARQGRRPPRPPPLRDGPRQPAGEQPRRGRSRTSRPTSRSTPRGPTATPPGSTWARRSSPPASPCRPG